MTPVVVVPELDEFEILARSIEREWYGPISLIMWDCFPILRSANG